MKNKMTKILELLKFLPALITAVMALVKSFEVPGFGVEKKAAVLAMVAMLIDTLKTFLVELPLDKVQILDFVGKAIDAIVAFLNAVNIFKKDGTNIDPL